MARTFPAVIINGILESGKTQFIIDSLKNGDFGDIGKVLIIATEDGEIEYSERDLASCNAVAHVFESPDDFNVQNINELIKTHKPHAVFFEMNAMWDWDKLQFPPYVLIEQTFTIYRRFSLLQMRRCNRSTTSYRCPRSRGRGCSNLYCCSNLYQMRLRIRRSSRSRSR